jgi:predicted nucleic acid-binding protein
LSLLLDTNAISEITYDRPNRGYLDWFTNADEETFHVSALSIGELRAGALRLGAGDKKRRLTGFIDRTLEFYAERILAIDAPVAEAWAELTISYRTRGVVVGLIDELIAATALAHGLTLITRNVRHFEASGCRLFSPWTS